MSSSSIRAGGVAIEIGADVRKVFAALNAVQARLNSFGQAMAGVGVKIAGLGTAASVPFAAAIRSGAGFESTLLAIKASAGVTEAELDRIRSVSLDMSKAMAMGPAEVATSFLELLKSGMKLEDVLGGAGKVAVQFAKVGSMELGPAAVALSDAMNVFGVSAGTAAAAISSAADASSTSIELLTQSFSMVSAVAAQANQSLDDTSAALAVLANAGVKGSDAGTSLKTMLLRLMAPADDAVAALTQLGLSTQSFRGADGRMKPLAAIIDTLNDRLQGMDQAAKDDVFRRIFGSDAIRAAAIFTKVGSAGLAQMGGAMRGAMPLGQKFDVLMSGLAGTGAALTAALQRAAVAITAAVGPSLSEIGKRLTAVINGMTKFATANADVVVRVAKVAVGVVAAGGAFTALGVSIQGVAFALGGFTKAISVIAAPVLLVTRTTGFVAKAFTRVSGEVASFAVSGVGSVLKFATRSGVALAKISSGFGTIAVDAAVSAARIGAAFSRTAVAGILEFTRLGIASVAQYSAQSTALMTVAAARTGNMAAAQVAATVSVVSASVARAAEGNMRAAAIGVQALARLGAAGTANAMVVGAQFARLSSQGSTQMIRLGASGATSLATIGTAAISTGSTTAGALAKASSAGMSALAGIASAGRVTATVVGVHYAKGASAAAASLTRMATVGVTQAAVVGQAWIGSLARMTAASAISGVAMAASFAAPFVAIGAAIAGAAVLAYSFRDQISAAFGNLGDIVKAQASTVGNSMVSAFGALSAQAATTFGEVYSIADTTFQGIYEAIAAGDMSQAFTVLWAGLRAAWVTGSAPIFGAIDQLTEYFQGVWGDAITWLAVAITKGMGVVENIWEASTRSLTTAWSVAINSVMDIWDTAVGAIQKAIAYIRSFLDKSIDYKAVRRTIDEANKERKDERDRQVAQRDPAFARQMAEREKRDTQTIDTLVGDNEREKERRAERSRAAGVRRQEEAAAAGAGLAAAAGVSKERKFIDDAGAATSIDQLRELYAMAEEAMRAGKITGEQFERVQRAIDDQQLEVDHNRALADQEARQQEALSQRAQGMEASAAAAGVETSGTFSTAAAAMLGQGGSLAERTAKAVEETAKNTRDMADGGKVLT
jgi:TP901 family phage tail tape measure protein